MKKVLILLGLIILLVGCSKENAVEAEPSSESTIESSSRTTLSPTRIRNTKSTSTVKTEQSSQEVIEKEVSEEQKALLIVFTQQDMEDYGYDYKYQGKDSWNVVTQDVTEIKRFIITTNDSKLGKIKSIYEWSGNKDDGATLLYFLVGGEELVNKLNQ